MVYFLLQVRVRRILEMYSSRWNLHSDAALQNAYSRHIFPDFRFLSERPSGHVR
ncbi:unnamed protein product, partial [Nesidiocoris tenuis]